MKPTLQCGTEQGIDEHPSRADHDAGHEQFFAARDAATGVQLGFISRTGHRVGIAAANVLTMFDELSAG